jgi:hypothetical protein
MQRLKPRTNEKFFLDKFLVKFISSCARKTIFLINFSVTSFITGHYESACCRHVQILHVYLQKRPEDESNFNTMISINFNSISLSIFPGRPEHRGETSAHASILLKSVLRTCCQVFRMLSKTQNGSDFDVLPFLWKCKRNNERDNLKTRNNYSLHVQEVVLCKKINQRWLSINLLYKTFFKVIPQ